MTFVAGWVVLILALCWPFLLPFPASVAVEVLWVGAFLFVVWRVHQSSHGPPVVGPGPAERARAGAQAAWDRAVLGAQEDAVQVKWALARADAARAFAAEPAGPQEAMMREAFAAQSDEPDLAKFADTWMTRQIYARAAKTFT
jgi:hypothetical protein